MQRLDLQEAHPDLEVSVRDMKLQEGMVSPCAVLEGMDTQSFLSSALALPSFTEKK